MESRTLRTTTAWLVALASVLVPATVAVPAAGAATAADAVSPWTRPVAGRVVRPFVAPRSRYGAGHRGADLAAAPGTPVLAAGAGRVTFAGPVAGTLHVVVEHADGLKTSVSFLATVAVRGGQTVRAGEVLGTAGGSGPDHAVGVVHLALRVRGEYVDPMQLFAAVDLTKAVHLAPLRHRPPQRGLDPPAAEARDLARVSPPPAAHPGPRAGAAAQPVGPGDGRGRRHVLRRGRAWASTSGGRSSPPGPRWPSTRRSAPAIEDLRSMASRLAAYVRSRSECSDDTTPGAGRWGIGPPPVRGRWDRQPHRRRDRRHVRSRHARARLPRRRGRVVLLRADGRCVPRVATPTPISSARPPGCATSSARSPRANPGREVDLVAHSQGGVVVDAFLALVRRPGRSHHAATRQRRHALLAAPGRARGGGRVRHPELAQRPAPAGRRRRAGRRRDPTDGRTVHPSARPGVRPHAAAATRRDARPRRLHVDRRDRRRSSCRRPRPTSRARGRS